MDGTFFFQPRYHLSEDSIYYQRADYTIKILGLNYRDYLVKGRRQGGLNYRYRLKEYQRDKDSLIDIAVLNHL